MEYDFTTRVNRHPQAAVKWAQMKRRIPDISEDIVPFSVADMELKNPPEVTEGLVRCLQQDTILGYAAPDDGYYRAVTGWMRRRHGWTVEAEWITACCGVVPALYDLVKAFAQPGEGVILLTPVYPPFYSAVTANGRRIAECPLTEDDGRYGLDFGLLEALAREESNKLLLFCSPHNPVGRVWRREELARVAAICAQNGVVLVSDEIHHDLVMPGHTHTVLASLAEGAACGLVTCTAPSKTFNLAGLQTANIIIQNPALREAYRAEQAKSGFGGPGILGLRACTLAYTHCADWLDQLLALVWRNYEALTDFLARRLPQLRACPLEGTYLAWLDFRALGLSPEALEALLVERAQVFMTEGYLFGKAGAGFERMNLACPTAVLLEALERIAAVL